jgi:hypothetical protein
MKCFVSSWNQLNLLSCESAKPSPEWSYLCQFQSSWFCIIIPRPGTNLKLSRRVFKSSLTLSPAQILHRLTSQDEKYRLYVIPVKGSFLRNETNELNCNTGQSSYCISSAESFLFIFKEQKSTTFRKLYKLILTLEVWSRLDSNSGNQIHIVRGCNQNFPDWPPGARTANGTALCH